jgi:hypothetical protein
MFDFVSTFHPFDDQLRSGWPTALMMIAMMALPSGPSVSMASRCEPLTGPPQAHV